MAQSTPPGSQFSAGDSIAGVTLVEPIVRGQRITCWRGKWPDGGAATAHVLHAAAKNREQDNFFGGARALQALQRGRNLPGVCRIAAVSPPQMTYVCRGSAAGTMEDVPILQWAVRDAVRFFRKLCHSIHQLHLAGLHHGCIRPANVLLDDDLSPVMSDVGMLVIDDSYSGSSDARHDYSAYAAREVRIGHPATVHSDVFSLGRLLYFCIHGEHPDEPDDELPLLDTLEYAPAGLVRIIRRATVRDPAKRYPSVSAFLDDLDRYEDVEHVGLKHPRGREGETSPVTDRSPDSERPSAAGDVAAPAPPDSLRALAAEAATVITSSPVAAQAPRPPMPVRRAPRGPGPTYSVAQGVDDDILSVTQARVTGFGGLLLSLLAIMLAYYRGSSSGVVVSGIVGAVALSAWVPAFGIAWLSRGVAAILFGVAAWLLDPIGMANEAGRLKRYSTGDSTVRGQRILSELEGGRTDFTKLDLRQCKFEGMNLTGARFDEARLNGASFARATLTDVSFRGAAITEADFRGADLTTAHLTLAVDWIYSFCDDATRMPEGWVCNEDSHPESVMRADGTREGDDEPEGRLPPAARPRPRTSFDDQGPTGNLGKGLEPPPAPAPQPETTPAAGSASQDGG